MGIHENLTGAQRTARYRAAKKAKGLRLRQFWVPDLRDPKVREEIKRQVAEINHRSSGDTILIRQGVLVTVRSKFRGHYTN